MWKKVKLEDGIRQVLSAMEWFCEQHQLSFGRPEKWHRLWFVWCDPCMRGSNNQVLVFELSGISSTITTTKLCMKSDNLRIHYREGLFYGSYGCKEHPNLQVLGQLLSNKDTIWVFYTESCPSIECSWQLILLVSHHCVIIDLLVVFNLESQTLLV